MISVVSVLKARICERDYTGYGSLSRAQNPAGYEPGKNICPGSRKNREKLLNKFRPCRNNNVHIDLLVLILNPIKTSAGRYVFVDKPLKSVA